MMSGLRRHEEEVRVEPGAEQQEMVCSKCGEMIVGRAMKVRGEVDGVDDGDEAAGGGPVLAREVLHLLRLRHQAEGHQGEHLQVRSPSEGGLSCGRCSRRTAASSSARWTTRRGSCRGARPAAASSSA